MGVIASILGSLFVKIKGKAIMGALYQGLIATVIFCAILFYPVISAFMGASETFSVLNLYLASMLGVLVTGGMFVITEYYTGTKYNPVKLLASASQTGHATNMIAGLALSMRSTFLPVVLISTAVLMGFGLAGIVVAIDAFGPITDNAGGIAEMANLSEKVRNITDPLDAVGNTTKAVTKAYP